MVMSGTNQSMKKGVVSRSGIDTMQGGGDIIIPKDGFLDTNYI